MSRNQGRSRSHRRYLWVIIGILFISLAACGSSATRGEETLVLAYDGWTGTYLPTYVLKNLLEDELGYQVKVSDYSTIPDAFESVSNGKSHIYTSAWFPIRDATFAKYPDLVKVGQVYGGDARDAYEGWMIPAEVAQKHQIKHVSDLRDPRVARDLDPDGNGRGNLVGCPRDWVCARKHAEIMRDYGLEPLYEIDVPATEAEFREKVEAIFRQGRPALFYMLQPTSRSRDVPVMSRSIWLEGTETYLPVSFDRTLVRNDFPVNHPRATALLLAYKIPGQDIADTMTQMLRQGTSEGTLDRMAENWIRNHRAEVDSWLAATK